MKEIDLLEKIIKIAVKEAVKEELTALKEEVKKVKLLAAQILKEGNPKYESGNKGDNYTTPINNSLASKLVNEVNGVPRFNPGNRQPVKQQHIPAPDQKGLTANMLAEAAMHVGYGDDSGLPDIDVPISAFLNMNNQMYHNVVHDINYTDD